MTTIVIPAFLVAAANQRANEINLQIQAIMALIANLQAQIAEANTGLTALQAELAQIQALSALNPNPTVPMDVSITIPDTSQVTITNV